LLLCGGIGIASPLASAALNNSFADLVNLSQEAVKQFIFFYTK